MKPSYQKYIPFKQIDLPDRKWPNNTITKAPIWCSVDLRDGNQALIDPMTMDEKLEFFYNSTSTLQRKVVFKTDMQGVIDIAVDGARLIKKLTDEFAGDTNIRFEYSPESFSGTEPENAVAICDRVMEELGSTKENPVILNLPNTVEMCTPNTCLPAQSALREPCSATASALAIWILSPWA